MSPTTSHLEKPAIAPQLVLGIGVLSVSTGAILVRYAQDDASSLAIAAYRMGAAFLVVLIPTLVRHRGELLSLPRRDLGLATLSGLALALHFATWISSLAFTSVANSVVLVNTIPLWVGLLSPLVTRERLAKATIASILLSVGGTIIIGLGLEHDSQSTRHLLGGSLAVVGAISAAVYILIGRNLRRRHSLLVYVTVCYGAAAMFLWLGVLVTRQPVSGFSGSTWLCLLALALVSQILGHTSYNWALRYFSASMIAISLLGEPVLSTVFAFLLFHESLTGLQAVGAVLILAGIFLAARAESET